MDKKLEINQDRIALDEAYMQMAEIWAKRSKAVRLQVGALLVNDGGVISDGYNGMPSGTPPEEEVCEYIDSETGELRTKPQVLHAEANSILKLATEGRGSSKGATLYVKYSPCPECAKLIQQAKIARVVYRHHYRLPKGVIELEKNGIICDQLKNSNDQT